MTTQDSITIRELAENRMEKEFPYGFTNGFPPPKHSSRSERRRCAIQKRKSGSGQKRGKCGSDPTLFGFQPPKKSWDRSRTFLKPLARATTATQPPCTATCMTAVKAKGEKTLTFIGTRITQASGLTCSWEEAFAKGDTARNREDSKNYTLHFFSR